MLGQLWSAIKFYTFEERWENSLFLNGSCCCLETGLKLILLPSDLRNCACRLKILSIAFFSFTNILDLNCPAHWRGRLIRGSSNTRVGLYAGRLIRGSMQFNWMCSKQRWSQQPSQHWHQCQWCHQQCCQLCSQWCYQQLL